MAFQITYKILVEKRIILSSDSVKILNRKHYVIFLAEIENILLKN